MLCLLSNRKLFFKHCLCVPDGVLGMWLFLVSLKSIFFEALYKPFSGESRNIFLPPSYEFSLWLWTLGVLKSSIFDTRAMSILPHASHLPFYAVASSKATAAEEQGHWLTSAKNSTGYKLHLWKMQLSHPESSSQNPQVNHHKDSISQSTVRDTVHFNARKLGGIIEQCI